MTELITLADIQAFKPVSSNVDQAKKLIPYILEAQEFDLRPILGEELYIDLLSDFVASPSLATYEDLFNGSTYTYAGKTYQHSGVKAVLVYYAYARYKSNSNVTDTAFGSVGKTTPYSTPSDEKTIVRQVQQIRAGAVAYQDRVVDFLNRNSTDYPLWKCNNVSKPRTGFKINSIGGNRKVGSSYKCLGCGRYTNCICNY